MTGRIQAWAGGVVALLSGAALGTYLASVGLDAADKWASVLGLFVGLGGLAVSMAGLCRTDARPGGQSVNGSSVARGVTQIRNAGSVRITRRGTTAATDPLPPAPIPGGSAVGPPSDGQSVHRTTTSGPVDQMESVRGDIEIEDR